MAWSIATSFSNIENAVLACGVATIHDFHDYLTESEGDTLNISMDVGNVMTFVEIWACVTNLRTVG